MSKKCWRGIVLIYAVLLNGAACSPEFNRRHDNELEQKLLSKLASARDTRYNSEVDLNTLFERPWIKACLQSPYLEKEAFEKAIGEKVSGYEYVGDDFYVLWVFYQDGSQAWAKIHRMSVMDKAAGVGPSWTTSATPKMYVSEFGEGRKFHFKEK